MSRNYDFIFPVCSIHYFFPYMLQFLDKMTTLRFLVLMYSIALIMRVGAVVTVGQLQDVLEYEPLIIGKNISEGYGFSLHWPYRSFDETRFAYMHSVPAPEYGTTFIPPIVPYLYGGYIAVMGMEKPSLFILMMIQACIGAFLPILCYYATLYFFGYTIAKLSSLCSLVYLPAALAATTFSGAVLYPLAGLGVVIYIGKWYKNPSAFTIGMIGIFSGIVSLMRSEFYYIFFVLLGALFFLWSKHHGWQKQLQYASVCIIAFFITTGWWTFRNYHEFGRIIPVTGHPWREIWRGYNPYSTGSGSGAHGFKIWENQQEYAHITRALDSIPFNNQFEEHADKVYKKEVMQFVTENTSRSLWLVCKKICMFWTIDIYYEKARHILYILPQLFVLSLTVIGIYSLYQQNQRIMLMPWCIFFLCYSGVFALTYVLPRYQSYVFPLFFPLCGYGLMRVGGYLKLQRSLPRL